MEIQGDMIHQEFCQNDNKGNDVLVNLLPFRN